MSITPTKMTKHISNIFQFDKQSTHVVYNELTDKFQNNKTESFCLPKIKDAAKRQVLDIGIDFNKPWEEVELDDYYQIEYLFVGRLESKNNTYILDDQIGINVFEDTMFGKTEFGTEEILSLTLIIEK